MDQMMMPGEPVEGVVDDIEIRRSTLQIEQKRIFFNLRENGRGRYLRIVEATGANRSTIIIPSSGLQQFRSVLDEFINESVGHQGQQAVMPGGRYLTKQVNGTSEGKKKKKRNKKGGAAAANSNAAPAAGADGDSACRVFVGNISWNTTEQVLHEHFQGCGEIIRANVFTEQSGRSRGCGIVEFANEEQARHAIATMADSLLDGRPLIVREDRR